MGKLIPFFGLDVSESVQIFAEAGNLVHSLANKIWSYKSPYLLCAHFLDPQLCGKCFIFGGQNVYMLSNEHRALSLEYSA